MAHSNSSIPVILLAFANNTEAPLRELAHEQDELNEVLYQVHDAGRCGGVCLGDGWMISDLIHGALK